MIFLGKKEIFSEDCNKIDMYSLGSLLYNLAFGEYPYNFDFSDKKNFKNTRMQQSHCDLFASDSFTLFE